MSKPRTFQRSVGMKCNGIMQRFGDIVSGVFTPAPSARTSVTGHIVAKPEIGQKRASGKLLVSAWMTSDPTPADFDRRNYNCDAGVTQNLPSLPELTSLTLRDD